MKMSKRIKQIVLFIGVIIILILTLKCIFKQPTPTFYSLQKKAWAHRGLSLDCSENTLQSTNLAFKNGFPGVEMDIWYNEQNNNFEVRHDKNTKSNLFLNDILAKFNMPNNRFWLDLKNLSANNEEKIILLFKNLDKKYKIKKRIIIESPNAKGLNKIQNHGFFVSLYLKPINNLPIIVDIRNNLINVFNNCFYNFSAVSLPADSYEGIYRFLYKRNNVHLWKFTKKHKELKKLEDMQEVKIILFDGKL